MIFEFSAIGTGTPFYGVACGKDAAIAYRDYLNLGRVQNLYSFRQIPASEAGKLLDLDAFVDFMEASE